MDRCGSCETLSLQIVQAATAYDGQAVSIRLDGLEEFVGILDSLLTDVNAWFDGESGAHVRWTRSGRTLGYDINLNDSLISSNDKPVLTICYDSAKFKFSFAMVIDQSSLSG